MTRDVPVIEPPFWGSRVLESAPKAMLVMLFLGIISAFVQIWRISQEPPK